MIASFNQCPALFQLHQIESLDRTKPYILVIATINVHKASTKSTTHMAFTTLLQSWQLFAITILDTISLTIAAAKLCILPTCNDDERSIDSASLLLH